MALLPRQAAKATLPWMPEQQTPVKHVTRFEKSREEREYDLVLGKFRDAERELSHTRQETQAFESNLENARVSRIGRLTCVASAAFSPNG